MTMDSSQLKQPLRSEDESDSIKARDPKCLPADLACVRAIAQAAANVELFTIPLYMTALYSVKGMHQITSAGSSLYQGRWWPGAATTPRTVGLYDDRQSWKDRPLTTNEKVFNSVYSVFIEEMLHLQLASNMASVIGVTPSFTSPALQTETYGWHCYDNRTAIPHILDLEDLKHPVKQSFFQHAQTDALRVRLRELDLTQLELFLLIEETSERATTLLNNEEVERPDGSETLKYFSSTPFDWFTATMTEENLPYFGSIGHMYLCYWDYLEIAYTDGTTLLGKLIEQRDAIQRDQFNAEQAKPQYPGIDGTIDDGQTTDLDVIKANLLNNVNAITDQGEGKEVVPKILAKWSDQPWVQRFQGPDLRQGELDAVQKPFQPDPEALMTDYPGYNDKGQQTAISGNAQARIDTKDQDHFEIFTQVKQWISESSDYETWADWHKANPGHPWKAEMLGTDGETSSKVPSTQQIADALNRLNQPDRRGEAHHTFSQSAVGTLKGLTTQLNKYWNQEEWQFPSPAMVGSGDRVSICWAVTGQVPNLVDGIASPKSDVLYHACQGMDYMSDQPGGNDCAHVVTYHSCKGSNACKAQGGCGFVQSASGGGSCGGHAAKGVKSAPADNLCGGFGGCAVPISASQLFPKLSDDCYQMQLYEYGSAPDFKATKIPYCEDPVERTQCSDTMPYEPGDAVYEIAWKAFCQAKGLSNCDPPEPNDIRLALPPST